MLSVIVRRSTLTMRSTIGMSRKRPGPFGSGRRRPSRKMMPRSYSRATLIAANRKMTRRIAMATTTAIATVMRFLSDGLGRSYGFVRRGADVQNKARIDGVDADPGPAAKRFLAGRPRAPELAVHEDLSVAADLADLADDRLRPDADRPPPDLHRLGDRKPPEQAEDDG